MATTTGRKLTREQRQGMLYLRHGFRTEPHFVAYLGRRIAGAGALDRPQHLRPAAADLDRAHTGAARTRPARYADQMIFEGFVP